jgi:diguanylate cyclase (GGDEF)-like protein
MERAIATEGQARVRAGGEAPPAAPSPAATTPPRRSHPADTSLSGRDVAMGWILVAMIAFGVVVGLAFPYMVRPLVNVQPGQETVFRLACIVAGMCVGGFAYGVARFTLYRANLHLGELAAYDGLTGLYNRRQFAAVLESELARARRAGDHLSLVVADLDHFKRVNDKYGHLAGDDALANVALSLRAILRASDAACRIGGEELAVVLPGTGKEQALLIAERLRACVQDMAGDGPPVTVSCGVATFPGDAEDERLLTSRADDAMYAAKAAGRNTVRAWTTS